jgi:translation initiation factor eIF-2B subunit alpha
LINSKKSGFNFIVYITEGKIDNSGERISKIFTENNIEHKVILDISVGYYMKDVDCAIVGAEAVCENGGVINKVGTFTLALCAKAFKKPFYVMVDSLRFLKMYPLDQYDIPQYYEEDKDNQYIIQDYTPPEFISLMFTDIGIFTPSAVSDELIQMYYN